MISKMKRLTLNGEISCSDLDIPKDDKEIFTPISPIEINIPVLIDKKVAVSINDYLYSKGIKKIIVNRLNLKKDEFYKNIDINVKYGVIDSAIIVYKNPKVKVLSK